MNNNKLPINTKVKIHSYLNKYYGRSYFYQLKSSIAYVREVYSNNYALEVVGLYNESAKHGYFYLTEDDFDVVELPDLYKEEVSVMNVNDFKGNYVVVDVCFSDNPNRYVKYRAYHDGYTYNEGDTVVVKTAHHGLAVAKIAKIHPDDEVHNIDGSREIVCPVDTTEYNKRVEKAKKIAELTKRMDAEVKKLQGLQLYGMMAAYSPELREMLKEYKEITGLGDINEDQA